MTIYIFGIWKKTWPQPHGLIIWYYFCGFHVLQRFNPHFMYSPVYIWFDRFDIWICDLCQNGCKLEFKTRLVPETGSPFDLLFDRCSMCFWGQMRFDYSLYQPQPIFDSTFWLFQIDDDVFNLYMEFHFCVVEFWMNIFLFDLSNNSFWTVYRFVPHIQWTMCFGCI